MTRMKTIFKTTRKIAVLAAAFFVAGAAMAQVPSTIENRYLFIFSTSSGMKPRLPAMQAEINTLLSTSMQGQMHVSDSIGVWTFSRTLRIGQIPLISWSPASASSIAGQLNKFVSRQSYGSTNDFSALQPLLDQVVQESPRLTVLIFCDGTGQVIGTPFDGAINQVFAQRYDELKRSKEPYVVVLRAQRGQYIGCTVNFSAGMVNLPEFPPYPEPEPAAAPAPTNVSPETTAPAVEPMAPILMVGTKMVTNMAQFEAEKKAVERARAAAMRSNALVAVAVTTNNAPAGTNTIGGMDNSKRNGTLALVAGLLIAAAALTGLLILRSRRDEQGSLISRSLKK